MAAALIALTTDSFALRQLHRAAEELGTELATPGTLDEANDSSEPPLGVVIDLELEDAVDLIAKVKSRWPRTLLVGHLDLPDPRRWTEALDAGCDLVTSRGALARQLMAKAREWRVEPGGPRLRLFAEGDIAGRIGLVARLPDTPVGPLAVYHIGSEILVVEDRCPHAGAVLSEGELLTDAAVITCPRHGSRFDLHNGQRLRGPADDPIRTFRVVVEGTEVYVRLQ